MGHSSSESESDRDSRHRKKRHHIRFVFVIHIELAGEHKRNMLLINLYCVLWRNKMDRRSRIDLR